MAMLNNQRVIRFEYMMSYSQNISGRKKDQTGKCHEMPIFFASGAT